MPITLRGQWVKIVSMANQSLDTVCIRTPSVRTVKKIILQTAVINTQNATEKIIQISAINLDKPDHLISATFLTT